MNRKMSKFAENTKLFRSFKSRKEYTAKITKRR